VRRLLALLLALAVVTFPVAAAAQIVNGRTMNNGQFACAAAAAQALPPNPQRTLLLLYNASAANVLYVGSNNGAVGSAGAEVSAANGFLLDIHTAGQPQTVLALPAYLDQIRCISAAGATLHYIEISR
jgi:hypothetical protein